MFSFSCFLQFVSYSKRWLNGLKNKKADTSAFSLCLLFMLNSILSFYALPYFTITAMLKPGTVTF